MRVVQRQTVVERQHGAVESPGRALQRQRGAGRAQHQPQRGQAARIVAGAGARAPTGVRSVCVVVLLAV